MSRNKQGSKTGRRERHLARQAELKARKKVAKARAARFAHLPGQRATHGIERVAPAKLPPLSAPALDNMSVGRLREIAKAKGCEVRSRHRKAELIAMIEAKYETIS
jgi:hypothetical protein